MKYNVKHEICNEKSLINQLRTPPELSLLSCMFEAVINWRVAGRQKGKSGVLGTCASIYPLLQLRRSRYPEMLLGGLAVRLIGC